MVSAPERVGSPTVLASVLLYATYPGQPYEHGIDCEKKMDEDEQQYHNQRSAQEQEQARAYQQWEQERARGQGPR
jgi:hypothetical protein